MPTSAAQLFNSLGIRCQGIAAWGDRVRSDRPGIYLVSLSGSVDRNDGCLDAAPIARDAVAQWIASVSSMRLDGATPTPQALIECLREYWLPDESVVYIGKATNLRSRLGQFFGHRLGERRPHAGGHWIKTLSCLERLTIHFASCDSVGEAEAYERAALRAFVAQVSDSTRASRVPGQLLIPFANREYPAGTRKQRRISGDVLRSPSCR